jgi:urease accessory protein
MAASSSLWLLLQLADGTFPNGGFAHSAGLEATMVLGGLASDGDPIATFLDASVRQIGRLVLPFVRACVRDPSRLASLDVAFDAMTPMAATNRSSRAQGRALASATSRVWTTVQPVADHARSAPAHHGPIFGAVFGILGVSEDETCAAYLHGSARTILSAGVRLGLLGPLEAQRIQAERTELFDATLRDARQVDPADATATAPLLDVFAALHDRLDGRMFQS